MKKKKSGYSGIFISFVISILLIFLIVKYGNVDFSIFYKKVVVPVNRMIFFIFIGLIIGEIIEATGWTRYLAVISRPLFRFANLDERCAACFTMAFFSGVGANSMLYNFYKNDKITKQEVILTNIMNHFPSFFLHLPSTMFIIIPLTGKVGITYLLIVFVAILFRVSIAAIYGHFFLEKKSYVGLNSNEIIKKSHISDKSLITRIFKKVFKRTLNIVKFVFPIFLGVFFLKQIGIFDGIRDIIASTFIGKVIPVEGLSMVVVSFIADYTSGFVTTSALLSHGMLDFRQGVIAILLGNIVAIPMRALRHQLPRFLGIFSPGLGAQVLFVGQAMRAFSLIVVGIIFWNL